MTSRRQIEDAIPDKAILTFSILFLPWVILLSPIALFYFLFKTIHKLVVRI